MMTPEYKSALDETSQAHAEYRGALEKCRFGLISDEDFLKARAKYLAADKKFDEIFERERRRTV